MRIEVAAVVTDNLQPHKELASKLHSRKITSNVVTCSRLSTATIVAGSKQIPGMQHPATQQLASSSWQPKEMKPALET